MTTSSKVPVSNFVKGMMALGEDKVDLTLISLNSGAGHKVNTSAQVARRHQVRVARRLGRKGIKRFKEFLPAGDIISHGRQPVDPGPRQTAANIIEHSVDDGHPSRTAPEELVYNVTKAIAENNAELGKAFGAFKSRQEGPRTWHPR